MVFCIFASSSSSSSSPVNRNIQQVGDSLTGADMTPSGLASVEEGYVRLYRACHKFNFDETQLGADVPCLRPGAPLSTRSESQHIEEGYTEMSAYISFTTDPHYAIFYSIKQKVFFKDDREVLAFDIEEQRALDISTFTDISETAMNFARMAKERLVLGQVEITTPIFKISSNQFERVVAGARYWRQNDFIRGRRGIEFVNNNIGDLHALRRITNQLANDKTQPESRADVEDDDALSDDEAQEESRADVEDDDALSDDEAQEESRAGVEDDDALSDDEAQEESRADVEDDDELSRGEAKEESHDDELSNKTLALRITM
ncbi:Uncharacterized protein PBTT_08737 [Plasmodiophora brassicae]